MNKDNKNKKSILLIEDDIPLLEAVQIKLEKNNFKVISARSVERAFTSGIADIDNGAITVSSIEKALKFISDLEGIDAIWLDHNLVGKENGIDFVNKFKANGGRWSKVPIFVVSNTSSMDLRKSYAQLGVNHYFVKAEHRLDNIISEIKSTLAI